MATRNEVAVTINQLSDLMHEVGFYSVIGNYTVPKTLFNHIAKFSIENDTNGFEEYQFICCIGYEMECFYGDLSYILTVEYADRISLYADGLMLLQPDNPEKYKNFSNAILYRRALADTYESRRKDADSFLACEFNRKRIFNNNGRFCAHCGSDENLSIDHIIPVVKGGSNEDDNLQVLCTPCNSAKGGK